AMQRGRRFIKSLNSEFPHIKILFLLGPSLTHDQVRGGRDGYSLLAPFVEGMCQAAGPGTQITDGFEQSYNYRTRASFEEGRNDILAARELFTDKQAFDRVMKVGFGLWLDYGSNVQTWRADRPDLNYFHPETWQTAIYHALGQADEYVWIYTQEMNWW